MFGAALINCIRKKGSEPLSSVSIVSFKEAWQWFRISRKHSAAAISGIMVTVSSTYLRYKVGSRVYLPLSSSVCSIEHMNTLARNDPRRDPMATPSVCPTRSSLERFKLLDLLNQSSLKALSTNIWIVSYQGR